MNNIFKLINMFMFSIEKFGLLSGFQILSIAINAILPKNRSTTNKYFFLNFKIISPNPRLLLALINEIFLKNEYAPAVSFIKSEKPVIIDCGSNIGISLLYWKFNFKNPNILAFEPMPDFNSFLSYNVIKNNINAKIENIALGANEEQVSFYIDNDHLTTGSTLQHRGGDEKFIVLQKKLSTYFRLYEKIDIVKIDIEGAESSVINELLNSNQLGKPESYIIEFHLEVNNVESHLKLAQVITIFTSIGYLFTIKSENMVFDGFQDLLLYFKRKDAN